MRLNPAPSHLGSLRQLPRAFFLRPSLRVAPDLLGRYLVRRVPGGRLVGRIVEVEAYRQQDPASHSYRGRTPRNEVMFRRGGYLYVYFTYGMHYCVNIVTGPEGHGEAVLIRAVEPIDGLELFRRNRHAEGYSLTNGPAKLCQAYGFERSFNGKDLIRSDVLIAAGNKVPRRLIARSGRIGIRMAAEKQWRFFIHGNPWVSKAG